MLIHANTRWPSAVSVHLWPFAMRHACAVCNSTPALKRDDGRSPLQLFSGSKVDVNPKHWVPFGCPVCVLDNKLQNRRKINKWAQRTRVGIYLGFSPTHARTVALVLSLRSGLASPQFHVQFDTRFATMRRSFGDLLPSSKWQEKCHFDLDQETPPVSKGAKRTGKGGGAADAGSHHGEEDEDLADFACDDFGAEQLGDVFDSDSTDGSREEHSEAADGATVQDGPLDLGQERIPERRPNSAQETPNGQPDGNLPPSGTDLPPTSSGRVRKQPSRLTETMAAKVELVQPHCSAFEAATSFFVGDVA